MKGIVAIVAIVAVGAAGYMLWTKGNETQEIPEEDPMNIEEDN